jgi:hypothetical protein
MFEFGDNIFEEGMVFEWGVMSVATLAEVESGFGMPGPDTAIWLSGVDAASLTDDELIEGMKAARRLTSWVQAGELALVAELIRRREARYDSAPSVELGEFIADEIALALTLSGGAAGIWAGLACKLADGLPLTRQALSEGRIDLTRAKAIADGLLGVDEDTAALVEQAVIGEAEQLTAARLRHHVREAIKEVDPEAARQRRERARKVRSLQIWANAAGTCTLALCDVSEEDAEAIFNRINAVAQAMKTDGDTRPIDAIRHDLGVALLRGTPLPEAAADLHTTPNGADAPDHRDPGHADADHRDPDNCDADHCDADHRDPARGVDGDRDLDCDPDHCVDGDHATDSCAARSSRDTGPADAGDERCGPCPAGPGRVTDTDGEGGGGSLAGRSGQTGSTSPLRPRSAGVGGGVASARDRGAAGDPVAEAARLVTGQLAKVIDERLSMVMRRDKAAGRSLGLSLRITAAMHAMTMALSELKTHWCETTSHADRRGATRTAPGTHGHDGYRPSAGMRRLIERTYQACAFPNCGRPASRCDLDHTIPWHENGPTCPCNMSPLCRHHHRLKQHPQWQLFQPWPGLLVWVTPSGKWHTVIPEDRQ